MTQLTVMIPVQKQSVGCCMNAAHLNAKNYIKQLRRIIFLTIDL